MDRQRLIDAYRNGGDFLQIANVLGVKCLTDYKIVRSNRVEVRRQRGGAKNVKVTEAMITYLEDVIGENPLLTLDQIKSKMDVRFPERTVGLTTTLRNKLDGKFYF